MRLIDVEDIRRCRGEDIINYEEKMRLIDADALYEHSFPICDDYDEAEEVDDVVSIIDINNAPTIDAVEVVRCKDCKYYIPSEGIPHEGWCGDALQDLFKEDFYCAYGERREPCIYL